MSLYTMRHIAKVVATGLFDREVYVDLWDGLIEFSYGLLALVFRSAMLLLFPVSVPMLWAFFRIMEPINARRRAKARRKWLENLEKSL